MKTSTVAQTAFLLALAAGPGSATRYSTTVKNFGVKFKVLWWDDGRDEPYRMAYTKRGIYSVFNFNAMGELQSITVEGEEQTFSTSRKLIATPKGSESSKVVDMQENVEADERELDQEHHRRRLYACSDCENTWNTLCNTGLADVCAVWSSGALKGDAKTAVKLFCKKFNKECDAASAEETCADDCTEDIPGECNPNPCENDGECSADEGGGHVCSCAPGYGGMSCQTDTSSLDPFYIDVEYIGTWTNARRAVFQTAADSATGAMTFDIDDIADMEDDNIFEGVILHEMAHVIGLGSSVFGLECSTCRTNASPAWLCPAALSAYYDLGGSDGNIIELDGGSGTSCGHLDETIFDDELMTGYVDSTMHLSKMTAALLDDLHYIVDPSAVDSYTLPSERVDSINAGKTPSVYINDTEVPTTIHAINDDGTLVEVEDVLVVF
eukprot:jgi/Undpi1/8893/HiC_scaffold_25.g11355.m1